MLERLASRIAEVCRADPRVVGAIVEVRKLHPPVRDAARLRRRARRAVNDGDHRAYIALGSNLGDRAAHLQFAVDELAAAAGVEVVAVSRVYETAPVGGPPQDAFLNAVAAIDTDARAARAARARAAHRT